MQYPIIDNLIYAYQRNGWTGLELTEGKNLLHTEDTIFSKYGVTWNVENSIYKSNGIPTNVSFAPSSVIISLEPGTYTASFYGDNNNIILTLVVNDAWYTELSINTTRTFVLNEPSEFRVYLRTDSNNINSAGESYYQIEKGSQATPYEPYAPPTTDIASRLKLPLPHYFPHPVIDALISAADGQQTEEENEILRHYLTPLGIGGI